MNDIEKQYGTRNATILMILAGLLHILFGYQSYQLFTAFPDSFLIIAGTSMMIFGVITLCTGLVVWLQRPWATRVIAGVGIAVCANLIVFGFYLMIIIFAPIFWVARSQLRQVNKRTE